MKKIAKIALLLFLPGLIYPLKVYSGGPLDPVKVGSWSVNAGMGMGAHYFGNGVGLGPAIKGSVETGMWDLGPGCITLGGEFATSFFSTHYGSDWKETWVNFFFAARSAYHYGWNVEGLDTYGGVPLGIGFCAHSYGNHPGSYGSTPVYPYLGFFIGASYFLTHTFGVNAELGYSSTYANAGVIFKLK